MGTSHLSRHIHGMFDAMRATAMLLATVKDAPSSSPLQNRFDSLVSLDAPSSYEPGAPARPYVLPALEGKMSAHGALRLAQLRHDAEQHRAFVHNACMATAGLAGWCTGLRVGLDPRGKVSVWIDDASAPVYPRLICNKVFPNQAAAHLESLLRAASYCDRAQGDADQRWIWRSPMLHGSDTRPYVAAGPVDAALLGLGLHAPGRVRDALLGQRVHAEVALHCSLPQVHLDIKERRMAVDAARKPRSTRAGTSRARHDAGATSSAV